MRINKYVALSSKLSRRSADKAIEAGSVKVNGKPVIAGYNVQPKDVITLNGSKLLIPTSTTIIFNKPTGYVVSREGQGSETIYDLLPEDLSLLNPVGRLDKGSSGLLLLTNDGQLAQELTHPSHQKDKVYLLDLYMRLSPADQKAIETGVELEDGISKLKLQGADKSWQVTLSEGRNRQIRRTFAKLGYTVAKLHRIQIGKIKLGNLKPGKWEKLENKFSK